MDHPHHSLYQLFALKNGNRGKDGKAAQAGDVVGGMAVTVDHDKVAAAQDLIAAVGAKPARSALAHCCNATLCHSLRRKIVIVFCLDVIEGCWWEGFDVRHYPWTCKFCQQSTAGDKDAMTAGHPCESFAHAVLIHAGWL